MADGPEFFIDVVSRGIGGLFEGRLSPAMRLVQAVGLSALLGSGVTLGVAIFIRGASAFHAALIVGSFTLALVCGFFCSIASPGSRR